MALTQPKRPAGGAYGIFLSENRARFLAACPGQPASACSKLAGAEWKKLADADKKPFEKKYEEAKAKFEKDMAAFKAAGGVVEKGAAAKRKERMAGRKKKDKNAPKRPVGGAYGQFLAEKREEIKKSLPADHKITEVSKKAGELWKKLSDDAKKPYEAKFAKAQEEYKKAFAEYKKNNPDPEEDEDGDEDEDGEDEDDEDDEDDENDEDYNDKKKKPAAKAKAKGKAKPAAKSPAKKAKK